MSETLSIGDIVCYAPAYPFNQTSYGHKVLKIQHGFSSRLYSVAWITRTFNYPVLLSSLKLDPDSIEIQGNKYSIK